MDILYIAVGILVLVLMLTNLYWGIFLLLIIQPLFFASWDITGFTAGKVVYGVIFAVWFLTWALSRLLKRDSSNTIFWHPMAFPTLALGGVLVLAIVVGLVRGNSIPFIVRDLSLYVGYLAVLPIIDIVRKPGQAKKIVLFLAIVGLPSYLLTKLVYMGYKQDIGTKTIPFMPNAQYYWAPIQGALWAVALSYERIMPKVAAWVWLIIVAAMVIFSGYRGQFLALIGGAAVAILFVGKFGRHFAMRILAVSLLGLMLVAVIADVTGVITIPGTHVARDRFATLLSEKNLYQDDSAYGRILEIKAQLKQFAKSPLVGVGLGFNFFYRTYNGKWYGGAEFRTHNGYGETLMKFGVVGTCFFIWYFVAALMMSFKYIRTGETFFARAISFGMVVWLFSSFILAGTWGSVFAEKGFSLTLGVMAGLLPTLANRSPQSQETTEAVPEDQIYAAKENQPAFPHII